MNKLLGSTLPLRELRSNAALALTLACSAPLLALQPVAQDPCQKSALEVKKSCGFEALEELWLTRANCSNLPTLPQRVQCMLDALEAYSEAMGECKEQLDARLDLCLLLGGGAYAPLIDPLNFVQSIDNPYLPLTPGKNFHYEKQTPEGLESVDFMVTHATKDILGIECTVVHDVVSLDGLIVEDTFDWFAQDVLGNVWYFGELSFEYEDGEIANMSGSWKAGDEFALPGIVMQAAPQIGLAYRQEFLLGEAEDAALVLRLDAPVSVPYGSFPTCLQTEDFSPLEPGQFEHKFYALGVGLVLETNPASGSRTELISVSFNP